MVARRHIRALGPAAVVVAVPRVLAFAVLGLSARGEEVEPDECQHNEDV